MSFESCFFTCLSYSCSFIFLCLFVTFCFFVWLLAFFVCLSALVLADVLVTLTRDFFEVCSTANALVIYSLICFLYLLKKIFSSLVIFILSFPCWSEWSSSQVDHSRASSRRFSLLLQIVSNTRTRCGSNIQRYLWTATAFQSQNRRSSFLVSRKICQLSNDAKQTEGFFLMLGFTSSWSENWRRNDITAKMKCHEACKIKIAPALIQTC